MEIFIRLSGVQLGPYSEQQVRQHIAEGLITLDDPAKLGAATDWAPLREILGSEAPPADAPVESLPQPAPSDASPESTAEPEPVEAPRRAPDAPPGVTHLPTRQQESGDLPGGGDVGAIARKTILIEPTAPIRAPSAGQAVKPISTTAPLASVKQTTKSVSRAAMIKSLAQKTSPLPTKAINAPTRPAGVPPAAAGGASPDVAKTVPMRNVPSAPPTILATEPMPTRHIFKPASGSVPPVAPASAPAVKEETKARPEASPSILTTEPMPTRSVFKPGAAPVPPRAPPAPEFEVPTVKMPTPIFKPEEIPPGLELEVPTVKIPPPAFTPVEKPPVPGSEKSAAEQAPPVPDKPTTEPVAPVSPKSPRRLLSLIIGAWAVLAAFMLYYVWSPYHAATSLRAALDGGDPAALDATIDFPAVRASLKAQINDMVTQAGLQDNLAPAGTKPPSSTVRDNLAHSVDAYVSADGLSRLVARSEASATEEEQKPNGDPPFISPDAAAKILAATTPLPGDSEGLSSVSDFVIDRGSTLLHLKFTGLGWKLKRVDLQPDLARPGPNGSAAPLVSPVVDTYLDQGRAAAKNSNRSAALAAFTQALAIDPNSSVAYNERASVRLAKGDLDGAISDFTQALAIDPRLAAAYNGRAAARSAKSDFDGAIADYGQALHFDPTLATAYDGRGNARLAKDDTDGAIADFTQAIALDPNMASAYSDRGFSRQANGNTDGAIADYTQALALDPKSARTYFNRGLALQAQGNVGAAIIDFNQALTFDPKLADAYYYRGDAKSANHDLDGAIADYTQAISLNAKLAPAYTNRGIARQAKGDVDGAAADYTQALALDPKVAAAYYNRAVIEAQKNNLDAAIADSTQALYLDAKNAQAYSTRGFAKLTKGNLDGALADLKQFCDLAPRDHNTDHVRLYLWLIAKAQNSGADADQDLSTALSSSWNSSADDMVTKTAGFLLGTMTEANYLAAAASPDAATDQAQHCQAWYFTGMKRLLMGDKKGAIDAFHQCVATQQKDFSEYVLAQAELQALEPPPAPVLAPATVPAPAAPAPAKKP